MLFKNNKKEIYVYIEKYEKNTKSVLIDFYDSNEFDKFSSAIEEKIGYKRSIESPSMVLLINYDKKKLREGSVYILQLSKVNNLLSLIDVIEDSYFLGYSINIESFDEEVFGKSKSFTEDELDFRNTYQLSRSLPPIIEMGEVSSLKAIIRDVGQGSWNEIEINNEKKVIFDIGTSYKYKRSEVDRMVEDRNEIYQVDRPICIISHWDIDHYHFLKVLSDDTIRSIKYLVCRNELPNLSTRIVFGRFQILNPKAIITLPVNDPFPKKTSYELLKLEYPFTNFFIYNGSKNLSRNKSGIGFLIRTKLISIIFSADLDYSQISNYVLDDLNYNHDNYLIVPHHGGEAGKFKFNNYSGMNRRDAIFSVGRNSYGHPLEKYKVSLKEKGFKLKQTNYIKSEIIITIK